MLDRFLKAIEKTAPSEIVNLRYQSSIQCRVHRRNSLMLTLMMNVCRNSALYAFPRELLTAAVASNLVLLNLSCNMLTELPQDIDQLRALQVLSTSLTLTHSRYLTHSLAPLANMKPSIGIDSRHCRRHSPTCRT